MNKVLSFCTISFLIVIIISCKVTTADPNNRPIIGILSQELSPTIQSWYPGKTSYIAASYVKFIEGAGGRVVPIWIGKSQEYYADIMNKINGILFPGGATYFTNANGYAVAGSIIYNIAIDLNNRGSYFPLWGTCLGFELLTYVAAHNIEHRTDCNSEKQSLPLNFTSTYRKSRLFGNIPDQIQWTLENKNSTANFHQYCVTRETMRQFKLIRDWRILSVNEDSNGLEFVSTIEHKKYPFYGVQFHPEKNIYEFVKNKNINHEADVVVASQYFAHFFVNETRKNSQKFDSEEEETNTLIYNYSPEYSGKKGSVFLQSYYF